jgi:putative ABC transport system permease protein
MAAGVGIALLAAYPVVRGAAEGRVGPALRSAVGTAGGTRAETWLQRWLLPLGLAVAALLVARLQPAFAPSQAWTLVSLALVLTLVVMTAGALPLLLSGVSASIRALPESPLWLRLAGDSLRQHRRRTGAVAASLMITLTILVGVFGMARSYRGSVAAWVDTMVGWDLMVSSGDPASRQAVSLSPALRYRLEEVPGVALASPERFASVRYGNRALPLYAYRFGEQPRLRRFASLSGASGAALAEALSGRRAVAISASLAPRLGLGVGDSLALTTPDGTLHYAIVAVVQDPGAASGSVYMDREVYVRDWSDRAVDGFALRLEPGSDPAEVARAITERFLGRYPLDVVSAAAFKEDVLRTVRATFGLSQGLIGVALLVALFGLLNAAMIGAWQLRHQLGVLRALGAPAALLSRTLMAEAWLTSLLGAGSGLVLGTLLSVALLRGMEASGAPVLAWRWPVTVYLAIAGLVALASVAAGRAPARVLRGLRHGEALHPD